MVDLAALPPVAQNQAIEPARSNTVGLFDGRRKQMEDWWALCRALRGGTLEMRRAGDLYLPMDESERQDPKRYEARLARSTLFAAYNRSVKDIASRPFQKPVAVSELPEPLAKIETDADREGTSLNAFAWKLFDDACDRGMALFLVDHVPTTVDEEVDEEFELPDEGQQKPPEKQQPKESEEADGEKLAPPAKRFGKRRVKRARKMNLAEEEANDVRPYFVRIDPDNFVGARISKERGKDIIDELRVREWAYVDRNGAKDLLTERIRVWTRTTHEVWERNYGETTVQGSDMSAQAGQGDNTGFRLIQEPVPHGFPGDEIPLVVFYTNKLATLLARPPLEDLQHENVAHWNARSLQTAALRYGRDPVLVGRGLTKAEADGEGGNGGVPPRGPGVTLMTSSDGDWKFIEPAGTSLQAGETEIEKIEERMRAMGMAPLVETAGPDTATGEMRAESHQQSQAQAWAESLEWGIYEGFRKAARWQGTELPADFKVSVFRDFAIVAQRDKRLEVAQVDAAAHRITHKTYLEVAKDAGIYPDMDIEAEIALAEAEKPPPPAMFGGDPSDPQDPDDPQDSQNPNAPMAGGKMPPSTKKEAA